MKVASYARGSVLTWTQRSDGLHKSHSFPVALEREKLHQLIADADPPTRRFSQQESAYPRGSICRSMGFLLR